VEHLNSQPAEHGRQREREIGREEEKKKQVPYGSHAVACTDNQTTGCHKKKITRKIPEKFPEKENNPETG
jgi:hypothetical protein